MTAVTYSAKRSIISGHSEGVSYDIGLPLATISRKSKAKKHRHESLSGKVATLLNSLNVEYRATTIPLKGGDYDAAVEFFDSVAGGEPFEFDQFGSAGTPNNPKLAVIVGDVSEASASSSLHYKFNFTVRIL